MKRLPILVALAAAALVAWPAVASASTFKGVVVAKQRGVLLVAGRSGQVHAVTTASHPRVGSLVAVTGRRVRVVGHSRTTAVRGVVVRRTAHTLYLAAGRRLLAVHSRRALQSSAADPGLSPGTSVQGTVDITQQGELEDDDLQAAGSTSSTTVTATVTAVAPGSLTVTVNGQPLTIPLPAGITLPATIVGQTITFSVSFAGGEAQAEPEDQGDDDSGSTSGSGQDDGGSSTSSGSGSGDDNGDGGGDG